MYISIFDDLCYHVVYLNNIRCLFLYNKQHSNFIFKEMYFLEIIKKKYI